MKLVNNKVWLEKKLEVIEFIPSEQNKVLRVQSNKWNFLSPLETHRSEKYKFLGDCQTECQHCPVNQLEPSIAFLPKVIYLYNPTDKK